MPVMCTLPHYAHLQGYCLQARSADVSFGRIQGHAGDATARVRAPVGGEQAGEGRHETHALAGFDRPGDRLELTGRAIREGRERGVRGCSERVEGGEGGGRGWGERVGGEGGVRGRVV